MFGVGMTTITLPGQIFEKKPHLPANKGNLQIHWMKAQPDDLPTTPYAFP
jgi:hypothetical protein